MTLRWVLAAVTAVVAGSLTAGCSGSGGGSSAAPTAAEIRQVLDEHASAVRAHDESAFLAGVSSGGASAAFRRRQAAQFTNLTRLPLASWSYSLDTRTDDAGAERAASKRYGSPVRIEQVLLHYALRDLDPSPTQHELFLTFLRRHGHVVIAGDADLAADGGITWRGPWDYGSLVVVAGRRSLVLGHPAAGTRLDQIAQDVDSAVPAVTAVWGPAWPQRVVVLAPASSAELSADAGPSATITSDIAAETVSDGADPLTRAAYGLRLIVNPGALAKLSAVGEQITLRHEITHIASGRVTSDASPRWLVEGFADYVGQLHTGQAPATIAAELAAEVRRGVLPSALPDDAAFDSAATAAQSYEQGWLACRLIAAQAGQRGLVRFYRIVGSTLDATTSVATALRQVLHETTAQFVAAWRSYLRAQLR